MIAVDPDLARIEVIEQGYDEYGAVKEMWIKNSHCILVAVDVSKAYQEIFNFVQECGT